MTSKRQRNKIEDRNQEALSEITNFIAQEAYKLAVIKQFPADFSRICTLSSAIQKRLSPYYNDGNQHILEELEAKMVNHIVFCTEREQYEQDVIRVINEEDVFVTYLPISRPDSELESGDNDCGADNELKAEIFKIVIDLIEEHSDFHCFIPHKYMPSILGEFFNFHDALEHIHVRFFIPTTKVKHKTKGKEVTVTHPPYYSILPYAEKRVDRVQCKTEEIRVPETALSKNQQVKRVNINSPDVLESLFLLEMLSIEDSVNYTTQINFQLDLSKPITNEELDKVLARLRNEIAHRQLNNQLAKVCLAETDVDLIDANRTPKLKTVDSLDMIKMHKVSLPGLDCIENAKDFLCALILFWEHWVHVNESEESVSVTWEANTDGVTLLNRRGILANTLLEKYGSKASKTKVVGDKEYIDYHGFSPSMIERGCKKLNKVIQSHIDDFQKGRVQFGVRLNSTQRKILRTQESVRLERLHPDDLARAEQEIERHTKQGRKATVKARKNGSFVICW